NPSRRPGRRRSDTSAGRTRSARSAAAARATARRSAWGNRSRDHATTGLEDPVRVERILQTAHEEEPGDVAVPPRLDPRAQMIRPTLHTRAPTAHARVGEEAVSSGHQHIVVAAHLDA